MTYEKIPLLLWFLTIAVMDFRFRKVNNYICFFGLLFPFFKFSFELNFFENFIFSFAVALFFIVFYAKGLMGAGDVKFIFVLSFNFQDRVDLLTVLCIGSLMSMVHGLYLNKSFHAYKIFCISHYKNTVQRNIPYAGHLAVASVGWMLLKNSL